MKQLFRQFSEDFKKKRKNTVSNTLKIINEDITTNTVPPRRFSNEFSSSLKLDFLRRRSSTGGEIVVKGELISLTVKLTFTNDPPLISVSKYKYANVNEGQRLIILDASNVRKGSFLVSLIDEDRIKDQVFESEKTTLYFKVPSYIFDINIHSDNIYMEALDILVKYPMVLYKIIQRNHASNILKLLGNRDVLEICLLNLFDIEINKINNHKIEDGTDDSDEAKSNFFDLNLPAIKFASVLCLNEDMIIFRNSFVNHIISTLLDQNSKDVDGVISNTVKLGFEFLINILKLVVPNELIILFKCLHKSLIKCVPQLESYKIIGNFFIQRCICPGLLHITNMINDGAQDSIKDVLPEHLTPRQLSPSRKIYAALKDKRIVQYVIAISKVFQYVGTGTIPVEKHGLYKIACMTQVLRTNLISFVEQVLMQKTKPLYSTETLYLEAYNLYIDILNIGRHLQHDEDLDYDPNIRTYTEYGLELRQDLDLLEDNLKYMYDPERIERIKQYLNKHL